MDGDHNGAFTEQLLQVWNHGAYRGTYAKFHAAIKARMAATQTPEFLHARPGGGVRESTTIQRLAICLAVRSVRL